MRITGDKITDVDRSFLKRLKEKKLNDHEWEIIKGMISAHELPCRLMTEVYGFSLLIHDHSPVPQIRPDVLLKILNMNFPFPSANLGFMGQMDTLRIIGPLTHNVRNAELLAWYGFEPLMELCRYEY